MVLIFTNLAIKKGRVNRETARAFALILSPFAPHMGEELWQMYGSGQSLAYEKWPEVNKDYLKEDSFEYPISFNGKLRFKHSFPVSASKEEIEEAVLSHDKAKRWLEGKQVKRVIVVPNKIVNIVVS